MTDQLNRFFVYGTLRPGELRWQVLEPYLEKPPESTILYGARLYTNRIYPFVVIDGQKTSWVQGEVVTIKPEYLDQITERLDMIEGYNEHDQYEENLFLRQVTEVIGLNDQVISAYIYLGGADLARSAYLGRYEQIMTGDWKDR